MWFPFLGCIFFLLVNFILMLSSNEIGSIEYEEGRFGFLDSRADLALGIVASVFIISAIIYATNKKGFPNVCIKFISYSFLAFLGLMAPLIWIPADQATWMFVLRHFQTIPFTWGLFFIISAILIIMDDLIKIHTDRLAVSKL